MGGSLGSTKKVAVGVGVLAVGVAVAGGVVLGVGRGTSSPGTSVAAATPSLSPSASVAQAGKPSASPTGPAERLAALDGNVRPVDQYQQVLDALAPRCTEDRARLTSVIDSTVRDLKAHGVDDEDEFGVLRQLESDVAAGAPRVACASRAAAYAGRREGS